MGYKVALGEICSFSRGASIPRARMPDRGDYLYIHYGDLYKGFDVRIDVENPQKPIPYIADSEPIREGQRLSDQDIVYVLTSETVEDLGHAFLFNNPRKLPAVAGTETTIVHVNRPDLVLPSYLNWLFQSSRFKLLLRQYVKGMKVFRVHPDDLARIEIEIPSIYDQRRIVSILDAIFERSLINSQINGYLAALLDASYSLATENGAEVKTLPEVVDIFSGGTPKTGNPEYWEGGNIPFFAPGDVTRSVYALTTEKHITEMGLANCNSSLYPIDTVFLTARGTVGKVAIAGNPMAMNQSCFAFRGKDIPQSVVFQIIKHAVKSLKAKANGATFAAINTRDLGIERVAIPSKDAMHAYDRDASVWLSEILTNEKENLRLANLRDALLPKLMSGEIDASKVDLTQLNSHLAVPSRRLTGHLTGPRYEWQGGNQVACMEDLIYRIFDFFPRLGDNRTRSSIKTFSPTEKSVGKGGETMDGSRRPAALLVI